MTVFALLQVVSSPFKKAASWRSGEKTESESSRRRAAEGQGSAGTRCNKGIPFFSPESGQTLEQGSRAAEESPALGDIQSSSGRGPKQPDPLGLLRARGWTRSPQKSPSASTVLQFYDSKQSWEKVYRERIYSFLYSLFPVSTWNYFHRNGLLPSRAGWSQFAKLFSSPNIFTNTHTWGWGGGNWEDKVCALLALK